MHSQTMLAASEGENVAGTSGHSNNEGARRDEEVGKAYQIKSIEEGLTDGQKNEQAMGQKRRRGRRDEMRWDDDWDRSWVEYEPWGQCLLQSQMAA